MQPSAARRTYRHKLAEKAVNIRCNVTAEINAMKFQCKKIEGGGFNFSSLRTVCITDHTFRACAERL